MRKLLSLLGTVTLAGCMLEAQEESRHESFEFTVDGTPRIEVRSDDGPIDVRGTSGSEVTIRVYCRARGPSRRAAEEILEFVRQHARRYLPESSLGGQGVKAQERRVLVG